MISVELAIPSWVGNTQGDILPAANPRLAMAAPTRQSNTTPPTTPNTTFVVVDITDLL
jgi:hypothetical protein